MVSFSFQNLKLSFNTNSKHDPGKEKLIGSIPHQQVHQVIGSALQQTSKDFQYKYQHEM